MKSVTIISEDRVGLLADISYILGMSNVNIEGLSVDVISGKAVVSLEVKDPIKATDILGRNGFRTTHPEAIVIKAASGAADKITEMLAGEKIAIKDFLVLTSDSNDGIFALNVDKPRKACRMLSAFLLANSTPI